MVWAARSHSFGRKQYFSTEAMRMFLTFFVLYHRVVLCHNKVQSISSSQRQFPPKRQVETFLNDAIAGRSLEKATAVTLKGTSDPNTLSVHSWYHISQKAQTFYQNLHRWFWWAVMGKNHWYRTLFSKALGGGGVSWEVINTQKELAQNTSQMRILKSHCFSTMVSGASSQLTLQ